MIGSYICSRATEDRPRGRLSDSFASRPVNSELEVAA
jgi:hypothetical protein